METRPINICIYTITIYIIVLSDVSVILWKKILNTYMYHNKYLRAPCCIGARSSHNSRGGALSMLLPLLGTDIVIRLNNPT